MTTATTEQLLDMLGTIDETAGFLRKRCASGQAGQSAALFEDLASLLELLDSRYRKSGYLPRERAPSYGATPDILTAVRFLDAVDDWSAKIRDRVKKRKVRRELALGGILEMANREGKPFARQAEELAQLVRGVPGAPEERAEMEKGVSVSFSAEAMEKARQPDAAPAAPPPEQQDVPQRPQRSPGLMDPAAEGERLFAGMRARTGSRGPRREEPASPMPGREPTAPDEPAPEDRQEPEARPMSRKEPETGARPMGRKEPETGARPMGRKEPEAEAKPMAPRQPEARPMGRAVEKPSAPETTTAPAVGRGVAIDREFLRVMNELGSMAEEDLEKKLVAAFPKLENRYKMVICDQMRRSGYWGRLEPDRNDFEALHRRAQELCGHRDEYAWLYGRLGDYRSRKTLLAILDNWYSFNFKDLANMREKLFEPYLDADLLRCGEDEVFVDAGAGTGDVTCAFAAFAGHWKKVYAYEPNPGSFSVLKGRVKELGLIDPRQKAVGDRSGPASLVTGEDPLLSHLGEGGRQVDEVLMDEDVTEPISILKLCLEGGEQAAIRGCSNHIHKEHPKLVLRADHGDSDLWQLPRMIERLDKKYRFFLRHYGGNLVPAEYVLYAI